MLSDRLMRSSAQLDRMLARLDEMLQGPPAGGRGNGNGAYRDAYRDGNGQRGGPASNGRGRPRPITRIGP
jgi:hypothetical protein